MLWFPAFFAPVFLLTGATIVISPPGPQQAARQYAVNRVIGVILSLGLFGFCLYALIGNLLAGQAGTSPLDAWAVPVTALLYALTTYRLFQAIQRRRRLEMARTSQESSAATSSQSPPVEPGGSPTPQE